MLASLLVVTVLAQPAEPVVARVDREAITAGMVAARLRSVQAAGGAIGLAELVEILVDEAVLAAEGHRQGLGKDPAVVTVVDAERRKRLAELYVQREIDTSSKVDDKLARQLFHDARDTAQVKLIVVASREAAEALIGRLQKGADFGKEALSSLSPDQAKKGGDLGTVSRGSLEEAVRDAAFKEPLGKIAGPLQLRLGWGVLKVTGRDIASDAEYEPRREQFRQFAESQLRAQARGHVLSKLRAQGNVALDEAFIRSTATRLTATPEEERKVLATVAGQPVRYGEVLEDVRRIFGGSEGGHFSGTSVKVEVAWKKVDELLLAASGLKAGLDKDPGLVAAVAQAEHDMVVRALAQRIREAVAPAGPAEVKKHYEAHLADFQRAGFRSCAHLVTADAESAKGLRRRALAGEDFAALASEYSIDRGSAPRGGGLGDLSDAQLESISKSGEPAFAAALRSARPGEVSEPVKTRAGWHLVRCAAAVAAGPAPLTEVKEAIAARLQAERTDAAIRAKIVELRGRARISVDKAALAKAAGTLPAGGKTP